MRRLWLVGSHEFIKYVTRRGFYLSVLLMPVWAVLGGVLPQMLKSYETPSSFIIVDHHGGYAAALHAALIHHDAQERREALAAYMRAHADLPRLKREAPRVYAEIQSDDADGALPTLSQVSPYLDANADGFSPPVPKLIWHDTPQGLAAAAPPRFAAAAAHILANGTDAILVIPKDFGGRESEAQIWQSGPPKPALRDFLSQQLTEALRRTRLAAEAPTASAAVLDAKANLHTIDPADANASPERSMAHEIEKATPFAFAFLLMVTIFTNAASLMSAVIEEKSSKIVEVMLSCVTPGEFLGGKLIGAAGASLVTLILWGGAAAFAAWHFLPDGHALLHAVGASLFHGSTMPMLVVCFISGLLIYCSIFLAIGSMTASAQDAQALIGPVMLIVMAPFFVLPALISDPNGSVATVLTWVPVYTPFIMMFRLPWNPPATQVWAALILMIVTAAWLIWQMGRVFSRHILTADKPPSFGNFIRSLIRRDAAA